MFISSGWWSFFSLSCWTRESFIIHRHPPHRKWGSYQILGVCLCVFRCEQVVLGSTSVLCATVRLVQSSSLLDQLVHFLLRSDAAQLLLRRCDHISDQVRARPLELTPAAS